MKYSSPSVWAAIVLLAAVSARSSIAGQDHTQRIAFASQAVTSRNELKLRLWKSNANISVTRGRNIFWINNDEVLFVRVKEAMSHDATRREHALSIWNIHSNEIQTVREFGRADPGFCYGDGRLIVYSYTGEEGRQTYFGTTKSLRRLPAGTRTNAVSCQLVDGIPALPEWTKGRAVVRLEKVEWGFVDFGKQSEAMNSVPIKLYRHGAKIEEGVTLPLRSRETRSLFRYFEFADAHFVESTYWQSPRPRGVPYRVYWLHRDGRVEVIADIPFGPWRYGGSTWTEPTKRGVLLVSTNVNTRSRNDLGHAGLYLVSGQEIRKLLPAWVEMTAVSPNGCLVAFDFASHVTDKENKLVAIDICGEEGM